ncbi:sigma 54-interacting transcriptional regulator (plasmid) [Saprospira sp. CCB-QB6]|uniref:sigma 54-interacting transcriptional regulator n=1 Tax=Saprospira sp. CCB-QB6 TaxID=3023936 RepID=UPI00234B70D1|nr:sigma 54-interacting transcriptional regulator [Saprospira sp. CCB-QB6]WCL83096.1 sigma 54-interacting transcriptional regulator [Saprospira sp. CCB-QB6]
MKAPLRLGLWAWPKQQKQELLAALASLEDWELGEEKLAASILPFSALADLTASQVRQLGQLFCWAPEISWADYQDLQARQIVLLNAPFPFFLKQLVPLLKGWQKQYQQLDLEEEQLIAEFAELGLLGQSKLMIRLFKRAKLLAQNKDFIFLQGAAGSGKSWLAGAMHGLSPFAQMPFQRFNLLDHKTEDLERLLFGQGKKKGQERHFGVLSNRSFGALLIQHIELLPFDLQEQLAKFLREGKYILPQGDSPVFLNQKLYLSSSKDLDYWQENKQFSSSLLQQLKERRLKVPSLAERGKGELINLSQQLLKQFCEEQGLQVKGLHKSAQNRLKNWYFSENLRELKQLIERSALLCTDRLLKGKDLWQEDDFKQEVQQWIKEGSSMQEYQRQIIMHQLYVQKNHVVKAAQALGIGKSTIYRILEQEELSPKK